jgi:hypothetical protein
MPYSGTEAPLNASTSKLTPAIRGRFAAWRSSARDGPAFRFFACLQALLSAALVAGCATQATIPARGSAASEQRIGGDAGGVAFRVTVSGVGVSQFFSYWHQVELQRIDVAKPAGKYHVAMSELGAVGSATYFGALPEGHYEISSFSSVQCGALCLNARLRLGSDAIRFNVERGKITYLGSLIYQREARDSARLISSGTQDPDKLRAWLRAYHPSYAALPIRAWADDGEASSDSASFRAAQDRAPGFMNPTLAPNGDVLFTTLAGSIRRLDRSGRITSINTGIDGRVHAALALTDSVWLAMGDFGEARLTRDRGATWEDAKLDLPYGVVRGLFKGKDREVVVMLQQSETISVYTGSVDTKVWTQRLLSGFKLDLWRGGATGPMLVPDLRSNRILVVLPSAKSFVFDANSYELSAFEFPGGVMGAGLSGDGVLRCRCNKSGFWVSTWESRDLGKSWQDSSLSRYLPIPEFRDAKVGFNTAEYGIQSTGDGGVSWKKVFEQGEQYWPLLFFPYSFTFVFVDEQRIVATDTLSQVLVSDDAGNAWRRITTPSSRRD